LALAPGLTWAHSGADGGDLLAAALTRGVPHPSGYPTYLLLLTAVTALFPGEPARAGNWLSAACAALAVALLTDLAGRMLVRLSAARQVAASRRAGIVALAAGLAWAASPTLWGQAVITEVYTLNALAVSALLWLLWRWREAVDAGQSGRPWLILGGLTLGLGLGNHLTLLLLTPAAGIWLWAGRGQMKDSLRSEFAPALIALLGGLAIYAYLPLAASAMPPVNWEDPRTPTTLWALVSGRLYRGLMFGLPTGHLPGRVIAWVGEILRQFGGPWAALLALAGLWRLDHRHHAWWRTTVLAAAMYSVYAIAYNSPDSFVYLIPAWCVMALWLAVGLDWLVEKATTAVHESPPERTNTSRIYARIRGVFGDGRAIILRMALVALILAVPSISAVRFWRENDLSRDHAARDFVAGALASAAPGAVILTSSDGPTFALWYAIYGLGQRPDVVPVNVNLLSFDWYRRALAARHSELAALDPARPEVALAALGVQRPLYRAETLTVPLARCSERPEGPLMHLTQCVDE
jgi:hypothetical protein